MSSRIARVTKTSQSTHEQRASAERNRDALTIMSPEDRDRYAGQFAVVMRIGPSAGKVLGHGITRDEAVQAAEKNADYKPMACSVRYIIPADESILAGVSPPASGC